MKSTGDEASNATKRAGRPWARRFHLFDGQLDPDAPADIMDKESHKERPMKCEIKRVSPHQCGKINGIIFGLMSLVMMVPMLIMTSNNPAVQSGQIDLPVGAILVGIPIIYSVMAYIGTYLMAVAYNFITPLIGGIEIELAQKD